MQLAYALAGADRHPEEVLDMSVGQEDIERSDPDKRSAIRKSLNRQLSCFEECFWPRRFLLTNDKPRPGLFFANYFVGGVSKRIKNMDTGYG